MESALLLVLGFVAAFASGLFGVGGAILLIPLLRFLPPALGFPGFTMSEIAGISIVQVTASALLGLRMHHQMGAVSWSTAAPMALASGLGAGLGGLFSGAFPEKAAEMLFAVLAVAAAGLMILPSPVAEDADREPKRAAATAVAGGVGVIAGLLGAGGAFLLAPLMRSFLGFPIRKIIGISLVVVLAGAIMGLLGKAVTGQVPWGLALWAAAGALPGASLGATLSHRLDAKRLRWGLALLITLSAVQMVRSALLGP